MNSNRKAHDLFLLLLNLSQLSDRELILRLFTQSIAGVWPGLSFGYAQSRPESPDLALEIATIRNAYGHVVVQGDRAALPPEELPLLNNAVQMLALLLERHDYQRASEDKQALLETEVARRTQELTARNRVLEEEMRERRRAEEALRESEERYRLLAENIQEVFWQVSPDWRKVLFVSQAYETVWGRSRESLYAEPLAWLEAVHPDDQAAVMAYIRDDTKRKDRAGTFPEYRLRRPDGTERWILARHYPVLDPEGRVSLVCGMAEDITERKQAEQELRYREARFRALVSASAQVIYSMSPDWTEMRQLIGKSFITDMPTPRGDWLQIYIPPDDHASVLKVINEAIQTQAMFELEHRVIRADGTLGWTSSRAIPVRDTSGGIVEWFGAASDITERKRAEAALRRTEALLRTMLVNLPLDFWARNPDGGIIIQSDICRKIWGDLDQGIREEYRIPAATLARWQANNARALAGETVEGDHEYVLPAAGRVYYHEIVAPIRDQGEVLGIMGVNVDLTDRFAMEEELRESERRYRTLFDQSLDAIAIQEGRPPVFTWVNRAFSDLFGYSAEEMRAMPPADIWNLVHPDDRDMVRESLTRRLGGQIREVRYEFRIVRKDGEVRWVSVTGTRIDQPGRPVNQSIYRDVTAQKALLMELTLAKEAAEAASRTKSEFLATMSHEIRTPLNGVLGMLQLAQTTQLDPEQAEYVGTALQSGRSLLRVLSDVLDISRIEAGALNLVAEDFLPAEVFAPVANAFAAQAQAKGLDFACALDPGLPELLHGDAGRIRQVAYNLVGNALKYTAKGQVRLEAFTLPTAGENGGVRLFLSVSDTGIGVPADKVQDIFEAFTQVDGSYTRRYGGTGLGLTIVKRLVGLMDGAIEFCSRPGEGTDVLAVLPLRPGRADAPTRPLSAALPEPSPAARSLDVLLAEDDRVNRVTVRHMLIKAGHRVQEVENGAQALAYLLAGNPVDCVLMDVQMPEMDGVEATRRIRAGEAGDAARTVPIVALTAHAMKGDREEFLAVGMDGYLAKPVDMDELGRILWKLASQDGSAA